MSQPIKEEVPWSFWFLWVLINGLAWLVGIFIGQSINEILGTTVGASCAGAIVGLGQWWVIQRQIRATRSWIWLTAIGVTLVSLVGGVHLRLESVVPNSGPYYMVISVTGLEYVLLGGLLPGVLQWLVLRQWVYQAGWWLLGSAAAWTMSLAYIGYLVIDLQENILRGGIDALEATVIGMSLSAILTGLLLMWLLRHPQPHTRIPKHDRWGSLRGIWRRN